MMASKTQRQLALLGGLIAVLLLVTVFRGGETPTGTAPPPSNPVSATSGTGGEADQPPVADIRLELLEAPAADAPLPERNLFSFEVREAPAPPRAAGGLDDVPEMRPVPQGPPPPPPIPLRFIGVLNAPTQAGRIAILSDGRGHVFYGREGDIIEGRYRLLSIGTDSAELAYIDGRGRQVIRLSGQ